MFFLENSYDYSKMKMNDIFRLIVDHGETAFHKMLFPENAQCHSGIDLEARLLSLIFSGKSRLLYQGFNGRQIEHIQTAGEAFYLGKTPYYQNYGFPCVRIGISLSENRLGISFNDLRTHFHPPFADVYYSRPPGTLHRELALLFDLLDERAKYNKTEMTDEITCALPGLILKTTLEYLEAEPERTALPKPEQLYQNICSYISCHFGKTVCRKTVASHFGVCPDYVSRLFQRYAGQGFSEYLLALRMDRAREMLSSSYFSVAETADVCGFSDTAYFIKVFRKRWDILPGKFKRAFQRPS